MWRFLYLKSELKFGNAEDTLSTIFHSLQPGKGIKLLRGGHCRNGGEIIQQSLTQQAGAVVITIVRNTITLRNLNAPLEGTVRRPDFEGQEE